MGQRIETLPELPAALATSMYLVLQECLANIPDNGLVCASVYCDQVLEKAVEEARVLEAGIF